MKKFLLVLFLYLSINVVYGLDFDQFDPEDINSLREATKYYQQEYKNKRGTLEAEEDYDKFIEFRSKFYTIQDGKINIPYKTLNNSVLKQIDAYNKQYYKYGLAVQFDEGEYMLIPSDRYLYKNFGPYISKPYRELLKFYSSDKRIVSDGRYIVPISYFENRIKFCKKFSKKYPEILSKEDLNAIIESVEKTKKHYPDIYY